MSTSDPTPPAAEPPDPKGRRPWLVAACALLALLGLTFADALAGKVAIDGTPHLRWADALYGPPPGPQGRWTDTSAESVHQPWDLWIYRTMRAGEVPLWQPDNGLGAPLAGNGQSAPFSPYKWLVLPWSDGAWTPAFLLGRLALAGVGVLALAAALGLSPLAGFLAGAGFMLNGFMCDHLLLADVHVVALLPWLVLAAEGLRRRPTARRAAVVGLSIGTLGLLGHPEVALFSAFATVVAYAAATRAARDPVAPRAAAMVGAIALGVGVAGVAVLPFLELVRHSVTYLADHQALFPWMGLGHILLYTATHLLTPVGSNLQFNVFIGVAPAVLVAFGVRARAVRPIALAFVGAGAAIYLLCPPVGLLSGLPYLPNSFYAPPLLALGLVLLAGAGFDRLLAAIPAGRTAAEPGWQPGRGLALAALGLGLALVAYAVLPVSQRLGDMRPAAAALLATGALLLGCRLAARPRTALVAGLLAITCAELAWAARTLVPGAPPLGFPATPVVRRIVEAGGLGRVAGLGEALLPNTNLVHGIPSIEAVEAFHPKRYAAYMTALNQTDRLAFFANIRVLQTKFDPALADLAGVRWFVIGPQRRSALVGARLAADPGRYVPVLRQGEVVLYESRTVLPRARVLHAADFVAEGSPEAARRLAATTAAWRHRALIETPDGRPPAGWREAGGAAGPAEIVAYGPHRVEIVARPDRPGWLVLADGHYPGWEAEVDGRPAPIHPAYVAFRAVRLDAGPHRVVFRYAPRSVRLGLATTLGALALILLACAWPARRRLPGRLTES